MSLKQSIVVVNRFTVKSGGSGTRGSTPGNYVTQYMGRENAIERIPPVRVYDKDSYIQRYMARRDAVESLDKDIPDVRWDLDAVDKNGGVAFGYGSVSLSDERFKAASRDIQDQFDKGKTVMETVVSFTDDYLKGMNVVSDDFVLTHKGAYKGNIDQLKLRMALMAGLDNMAKDYDDLQYVGCIQVDTMHVHCHLAMVDRGKGNLASDGTQKGKISSKSMNKLRRGIDNFLDGYGHMKTITSSLKYDRRNTLCYIKKFTHKALEQQGFSQFLLASLPEDKKQWRAGSRAKSMKKPNTILRNYVEQVLAQPNSGYDDAMNSIKSYASHRRQREGLSRSEYRKLCANGREALVSDCMNSVYQVLKNVPESEKVAASPIMRNMAHRFDDLVVNRNTQDSDKSIPLLDFGVKLRNYKSRLDFHKKESQRFRDTGNALKQQKNISDSAKPVLHYIDFETEYQTRLASKYQHFLSFLPPDEQDRADFEKLLAYREKMDRLDRLRKDQSMRRMRPKAAEEYGCKVYDMHGGRFMAISPDILDNRFQLMTQKYQQMQRDFSERLFDKGMLLVVDPNTGNLAMDKKSLYDFEDVKALDVHHMSYDFSHRVPVSDKYAKQFVQTSEIRSELYARAKDYLVKTNQEAFLKLLPEQDIQLMSDVADNLKKSRHIDVPDIPAHEDNRQSPVVRTLPLGKTCRQCQFDIDLAIRSTVQSTADFEELN